MGLIARLLKHLAMPAPRATAERSTATPAVSPRDAFAEHHLAAERTRRNASIEIGPGGLGVMDRGTNYIFRRMEDYTDGKHYVDSIPEITQLKRDKRFDEAERILLRICDAMETGDQTGGVAPWYYQQLAIIYAKQKRRADEVAVLERYILQRHAPGAMPAKLKERLKKLKAQKRLTP